MPIGNVHWITGRALHLDLDPIGSTQFEVSLDYRACEVVHFFECFSFAIVKVGLPVPGRMPAATCGAENKELRIGRPPVFLYIAAVLAIWGLKVLGCQDAAFHVADLDSRFVEWGIGMSTDG